jgi:carbon-monoxide dehydrogenase large subunit
MTEQGIGARVLRKEDHRFLRGRGRYTADIVLDRQAHAAFVRSPHGHATIGSVDVSAAQAAPGVIAVLTGKDWAGDGIGGIPCGFAPDGGPQNAPPRPALVADKARFVGDLVAMVIADSDGDARNAADLVEVGYGVLDANVDPAKARNSDAPLIHEQAPGNLCVNWQLGDKEATEKAFAGAAHLASIELVNNRKAPNAIEPRCSNAVYDGLTESYTLYTTTQNPHITRLLLAAFVLGVPESRVRIVSPDVGGGFGSKIPFYPEEALVAWASRKVGRPVKWTAERTESFLADTHGRDHVTRAELALDGDGRFLAMRVATTANLGAYLSTFGALSATYLYATLLSGQYVIPAIHCTVTGVFTNTCPIDAERGAGRPEATYLVERLVEAAARVTGIDHLDIRRRNFVKSDQFPYQSAVVLQYDSGDYDAVLDEALAIGDIAGFPARKAESAKRGRLRGIGFSNYIEACGIAPSNVAGAIGAGVGLYESAELRFNPTGTVSVLTGTQTQGQGHETTFSQVVASKLGLPFDSVEIVHGDTARVQWGHGTYGSRSLAVGGSAIAVACERAIEKGKRVAAHLLEASASDIEFADGTFKVSGTDRSKTMAEIIMAAMVPHNFPLDEMDPGLDQRAFYDPKNFTFPAGCHICEVEVDAETGVVEVASFTAVDDFGNVVNPMIVEGQIHGGVVHGIGQALYETAHYDETGQLVTGSYMDYAMPRADNVPSFVVGYKNTPCPHNPLGVKGCGEAGAIAAPAAVINAVSDAIGVDHIDMPATPEKVWRAMREAGSAIAA